MIKIAHIVRMLIIAAVMFAILQAGQQASAQLILVNLKVKIVEVQRKDSRLQVRVHEGGNADVQYIEIDANTSFSYRNRRITYDQAWGYFRKGMIIRVKGGYTVAFHVKAKQIYW